MIHYDGTSPNHVCSSLPHEERLPPRIALGREMVRRHVPRAVRERVRSASAYLLVLRAPSHKHAVLYELAIRDFAHDEELVITVRDGRQPDLEKFVVAGLLEESPVVLICSGNATLSPVVEVLIDAELVVGGHDVPIIARAIKASMGGRLPVLPGDFDLPADPDRICSLMLRGMPTRRVVKALSALAAAERPKVLDVPDLRTAVEFGEARAWGLSVSADLEAWRDGSLRADELDTTCLLVSDPGMGKTMFAKVLAQHLGLPLIEMSIGSLFSGEGHLGDVIQNLRSRFQEATDASPAVLLIDEIDGVGRRDASDGSKGFTTGLVNEMLLQLDGASSRRPGLVVVAATNRPDAIDPALTRPGRISRRIELRLPDRAGIESVLQYHARGDLSRVDIQSLSPLLEGRTPAEIMDMVRQARQDARGLDRSLRLEDVERRIATEMPSDPMLLLQVAVHECGHAVAAMVVPKAPRILSISILGRQGSLGRLNVIDDEGPLTKETVEARIMVMLAGRAAEQLVLGRSPTDGAGTDLWRATKLAARMRLQLGMADTLTHLSMHDIDTMLAARPDLAHAIENDLQRLMNAVSMAIDPHADAIVEMAGELVARKVLGADAARSILERHRQPAKQAAEATSMELDTVPAVRSGTVSQGSGRSLG